MSLGNGYLSHNSLTAFPLSDGQLLDWAQWGTVSDSDADGLQNALQSCFTDAHVTLFSESIPEGGWPSVGAFSLPGGDAISFALSAGGSSVRITVYASQDPFPCVFGNAGFCAYVISMCSEGIRNFVSLCSSMSQSLSPPASTPSSSSPRLDGDSYLTLCARCVSLQPSSLRSVMVYDGREGDGHTLANGPHFVLMGDIAVTPGNNVSLSDPDGMSPVNGFAVNADPGAGEGRVPCSCAETAGGNSLLAGPTGHARIFNDTCYDLEPGDAAYYDENGLLTRDLVIHAKCTACCTCSMYGDVVGRLAEIADRIRSAKSARSDGDAPGIDDLLASYESAVAMFRERLGAPALPDDVTLTLAAFPVGKNISPKLPQPSQTTDVRGKMSRCSFTAVLNNSSAFEVLARVSSISGTDKVVEASVSWSSAEGTQRTSSYDSASGLIGMTYPVPPGRTLVVTFMSARSEMVNAVSTGGFSGEASFDLSYVSGGQTFYLGRLRKTVDA